MAQVPCIGLYKPYANLPFRVCAMNFYPQDPSGMSKWKSHQTKTQLLTTMVIDWIYPPPRDSSDHQALHVFGRESPKYHYLPLLLVDRWIQGIDMYVTMYWHKFQNQAQSEAIKNLRILLRSKETSLKILRWAISNTVGLWSRLQSFYIAPSIASQQINAEIKETWRFSRF